MQARFKDAASLQGIRRAADLLPSPSFIARMPQSSSAAAAAAAAAIVAALAAYFIRRRRHTPPPPPPAPSPLACPSSTPPLFVAGHRLACSHLHCWGGFGYARAPDYVFLLSGANAAALEQRARRRNPPSTSSASSAPLLHSSSSSSITPSLVSRLSTQDFARRSMGELLPEAAPPVISAATRAYVAELQNKCAKTAFCFENA
jgi:hypothetical protein